MRLVAYLIFGLIGYILLSAFLLILPLLANFLAVSLPGDYLKVKQRLFYTKGTMRSIWQGDANCAAPSRALGYVPREGQCNFSNFEFNTVLLFDEQGAVIDRPSNPKENIIIVGDSHSMGWGVDYNKTFSYLLSQDDWGIYNYAVSSWGTEQEVKAAIMSPVFDESDYIVIQYCDNDIGKNKRFLQDYIPIEYEAHLARESQNISVITGIQKLRNGARFTVSNTSLKEFFLIPLNVLFSIFESSNQDTFSVSETSEHQGKIVEILNRYPQLLEKEVLIFYSNSYGKKFPDWERQIGSYRFLDLNFGKEHYYAIDDHLNERGHAFIASKLKEEIITP